MKCLYAIRILSQALGWALRLSVSGFVLVSCGPSQLLDKLEQAGAWQFALDHSVLDLWARSPTADTGNFSLTSASNLEQVPRSQVDFAGLLDQKGPLLSNDIVVVESSISPVSVTFYSLAGRRVPWESSDFQLAMAYHHATKALSFAKRVLPDGKYDFESGDRAGSSSATKLLIYAREIDDPFKTAYNPDRKSIAFYVNPYSNFVPLYNPVLEGDAIYHEMAHFIMQAYICADADPNCGAGNVVAMSPGVNPDLDAIQEGLADYFAAVVAGDDRTLSFFSNNARSLISPQSRTGTEYFRQVNNRARFPDGYMEDSHFDGRVVAAALNDFRKFLDGTGYFSAACAQGSSNPTCKVSGLDPPMKRKDAEEFVLKLAFDALKKMTTNSGFSDYTKALLDSIIDTSRRDQTFNLAAVLSSRGLLETSTKLTVEKDETNINIFDSLTAEDNESVELLINATLKWKPYPDNILLADRDEYLEPCELIMVYPDMENLSSEGVEDGELQFTNLQATLVNATGFKEVTYNKKILDPLKKTSNGYPLKLLGWLNPGEALSELVGNTDSRLYTTVANSTFTRPLGKNFNVPSVGWLVHAPANYGETGTMKMKFSFSIYNNKEGSSGVIMAPEKEFTLRLSTISSESGNTINQTKPNQISSYPCSI